MNKKTFLILFVAAFGWVLTSTGCADKRGPLEKAGKEIDDAVDDATDKEKSTGDKVGEKMEEIGDRIEDAG